MIQKKSFERTSQPTKKERKERKKAKTKVGVVKEMSEPRFFEKSEQTQRKAEPPRFIQLAGSNEAYRFTSLSQGQVQSLKSEYLISRKHSNKVKLPALAKKTDPRPTTSGSQRMKRNLRKCLKKQKVSYYKSRPQQFHGKQRKR